MFRTVQNFKEHSDFRCQSLERSGFTSQYWKYDKYVSLLVLWKERNVCSVLHTKHTVHFCL